MKIIGQNNWVIITNDDGTKTDPMFLPQHSVTETNADSLQNITEAEALAILAEKEAKALPFVMAEPSL